MAIPLTFLARYALPLLIAAVYLGDVDIPQQFDIFEKTQRLSDEALSKAKGEGDGTETFDYIIVGGGVAGAILANRLTASGEHRVLVLEAGGNPNPIMDITYAQRFFWGNGWMDWGYSIVQQNRSCGSLDGYCIWPRGKALGGSSSVNGLLYNRCKPKDYDKWASFTGDESWSWENVKSTFNNLEDYHGFYEATAGDNHGKGGEMYVGKIDQIPGVEVMEEALREKGIPLGDLNAGSDMTYGFSRIDYNIKQGLRWGSYQAFLEPILNRTNLVIYRYAYATQVDIIDIGGLTKRAVGVTYKRHGAMYSARANKEVILAGGVVESPKLLMLSGIGPKEHLEQVGIPATVDLPVGKHLQDHPGVRIVGKDGGFRLNTTFGVNPNTSEALLQYINNGTGPLNNFAYWGEYASQILMGYLNSNYNQDRSSPDTHVYILEKFTPNDPTFGGKDTEKIAFSVELIGINSTGSIKLASKDPEDKPIIDPNFLETQEEVEKMVDVIEFMMDIFLNSTTFQRLDIQPLEPIEDLCVDVEFGSREYWRCYIRSESTTFMHPTSTCRMGPNSTVAVVDSKLKVFGVQNLRVIDSSVMPFVPSGNTNMPTLLIAARGAEMILSEQLANTNNASSMS